MKKLVLTLSAAGLMVSGLVLAEEARDIRDVRAESSARSMAGEKPANLSSERVLGTYRSIGTEDLRLREGVQLYNEATRTTGTVTGNITVLVDGVTLGDIASEFGLSVVYHDRTSGIGQLNASSHDDLQALVEAVKASGMVRAARVDIIEPRYELDVIRR